MEVRVESPFLSYPMRGTRLDTHTHMRLRVIYYSVNLRVAALPRVVRSDVK